MEWTGDAWHVQLRRASDDKIVAEMTLDEWSSLSAVRNHHLLGIEAAPEPSQYPPLRLQRPRPH
jgi:hypothetical protein